MRTLHPNDWNWITKEVVWACVKALCRRELTEKEEFAVFDTACRLDPFMRCHYLFKWLWLAMRLYRRVYINQKTPHARAAINNMATTFMRAKQLKRASEIFELLLKIYGPDPLTYMNLSVIAANEYTIESTTEAIQLIGIVSDLLPDWSRRYPADQRFRFTVLKYADAYRLQLEELEEFDREWRLAENLP